MADARVRWLCRRGMKELDVLLERFLADGYGELDEAGRGDFLRLLEFEDPVLWGWLLGYEEPYDVRLCGLVERLREYRISEAGGGDATPRDTP